MKPLVFIFLLFSLLSCQKKSLPVITERKTDPPKKIEATYPPAGTVAADTVQGKTVFMARCSRCHALPDPAQFNVVKWEGILESMIPRARIDKENAVHVRAYVLANAAK